VVFTGGIGENAAPIRKRCCQGLEGLGITVDDGKNENPCAGVLEIQRTGGIVKVLAVRTEEEREIAEQTAATLLSAREGEGKGLMNLGR
jgi:acetate kinase